MRLIEALAHRLVGRGRHVPTEEEADLERRHARAVASLRRATAEINGAREGSIREVKNGIELADGMMREAFESGGD